MYTSWSSANQISNFKFSAFFRVLFALWSLKYPHPKSQQTPRVSTELEMVVNLSYSSIPLQKISQKGVDRSVENPQKRAENIKMAPNAPNKFSWRMRNKMPLCYLIPNMALHNFVPRSYRVTDWNVILPVKGLGTRLGTAVFWWSLPSTFIDFLWSPVLSSYMQLPLLKIYASNSLNTHNSEIWKKQNSKFILLLNDHWPFQVKF